MKLKSEISLQGSSFFEACTMSADKDVDDLKYATVLLNLVNWSNTTIMRCIQ